MKMVMEQLDPAPQHRSLAAGGQYSSSGEVLSNVSIVIPIAPDDESWLALVADLAEVGTGAELLLVGAQTEPSDVCELRALGGTLGRLRWIVATPGRAQQMNYGAEQSTKGFLWFLHADSRVTADAVAALARSLTTYPNALHYFELKYQDDGPSLTRWNAWGAQIRSQYLGLPFGDQGYCLKRELFRRLGGFNERAPYGEDHLLVWGAHRKRVPLRRVGALLATSARKYQQHGWLPTTLLHGWRTCRQAIPQFVKLLWSRIR